MRSICFGTVFSGVNQMLTIENGHVPQLFSELYLTSVPNEKFGLTPFADGVQLPSYVVLRGTFESGFKTFGPYQGEASAEQAGTDIFKKFAPEVVKMGFLPTWTESDDKILLSLGLPALFADVPPDETIANMRKLAVGLRKLASKNDAWAKHLYSILMTLSEYVNNHHH